MGTCVDGSKWSNGEWGGLFRAHIDEDNVHSYCDQLLSTEWHADEKIRSMASELCYRRIMFSLRKEEAAPWSSLDMPSAELSLSFETEVPQGKLLRSSRLPPTLSTWESDRLRRMRVQVLEIEVESTTWQQELVKDFEARQRPKFDTLARDLLE